MVSATASFQVVASTVSQLDTAPSVGINTGDSSQFPYPQYVPVSTPSPIPSKESRFTNINMPQTVLPNSSFNIIAQFQTFVSTQADYIVHLSIPQLQLEHDAQKVTLSSLAQGSSLFTVTLPGPTASSFGTITGTLTLNNSTSNTTDDSVPISLQVLGAVDVDDHHNIPPLATVIPPVAVVPGPSLVTAPIPTTTGDTAVILINSTPTSLSVESHGFEANEDVDTDIDIPMLNKSFHFTDKADANGIIRHVMNLVKQDLNQIFPTSFHTKGHHSGHEGHKVQSI